MGMASYGYSFAFLFTLISLVLSFASYIVYSIALMLMAKKCRIAAPALAWFPFTRSYLFGKVAERGAARNSTTYKPFRKDLLGFEITYSAACILAGLFSVVAMLSAGTYDYIGNYSYDYSNSLSILILVFFVMPLLIVGIVFAIIYTVNYFIAMWQVYRLFIRPAAIPFLLVSIFVSGTAPIFMIIAACQTPNFAPDPDVKTPPQAPPRGSAYAQQNPAQPTYASQQPYARQPYAQQQPNVQQPNMRQPYAQQPYVQQPYVQQPYAQQQPNMQQPYVPQQPRVQQPYAQQPYVQPTPTAQPAPAPENQPPTQPQ